MPTRVRSALRREGRHLLDAVLPPRCRLCGAAARDGVACAAHRLPAGPRGARCDRCARRLPRGLPGGMRCASCRRRPLACAPVLHLGDYRAAPEADEPDRSGALRAWLLSLKHGGRRDLVEPLAVAVARRVRRADVEWRGRLLVPVPAHWTRRLERGRDQAGDLAESIGAHLGLEVARILVRRRATPPQGAPGSRSRLANVRGAFAVRGRSAAGRDVWLVDDVVTSGATASECARVLRGASARTVGILCVARAGEGHGTEGGRDC